MIKVYQALTLRCKPSNRRADEHLLGDDWAQPHGALPYVQFQNMVVKGDRLHFAIDPIIVLAPKKLLFFWAKDAFMQSDADQHESGL